MSTNIIVFQPPEVKDVLISKTENEILYENFEKQASIPLHHFKTFMEMEDFQKKYQEVSTTIPAILLKNILLYCTPIIKELPEYIVKTKTTDVFKKTDSVERKQSYYNISLQLDYPIECKVEGIKLIKNIVIPPNEMFFIIGIKIPQKIIKYVDKTFPNFINSIKNTEILSSGKYGIIEFQSGRYTQSHIPELTPKSNIAANIYFKSDDDAKEKIMTIAKYIKYINTFYDTNYYMVNNYLQHHPFATYINNYIKKYNIFYPEFFNINKKFQLTQTLKLIEQLKYIKTNTSEYANNFLFNAVSVFELYNKINILGLNHPNSKKLIQSLDIQNENNTILKDYNKLKFKKKLELAKKKAISINKFNTSNLTYLTPSQYKIVNLEYDKLEKFYSAFQKHVDDFKIVNSLYWAIANDKPKFIQERLKEIYKVVKIPKKLENATQMLQNTHKINLICPHVITKAQKMLETYKSDLIKSGKIREYLINTFSLPPTEHGYFCRICGELITEADEEEVAKYIFGKRVSFVMEIDPLKQQIWKEVAQIMTSYVKFKESVNIKPIVNLMTDTLRPELGSVEANLIKIKSNTKDSIKNLMSIYISIYTFAMVVHMINNNYGKLTFSIRPDLKRGGKNKKLKKHKKSILTDAVAPMEHSAIVYENNPDLLEVASPILEDSDSKHLILEKNIGSTIHSATGGRKYSSKIKKHKKFKSSLIESDDDTLLLKVKSDILGGKQTSQNQTRLQNIINNALYLILKTKNITINNITSISTDSIKPILIKAYKWAATLKGSDSSSLDKDSKVDLTKEDQMMYNNHIYHYLVYAHNMYEYYKNPNNKIQKHSIKDILGKDWGSIEAGFKDNISIYANANVPELWNKKVGDVELSKYKYESFKSVMEYIKLKLYNENVVPLSSSIKDHNNKYKFLEDMEHKFFEKQKIDRLRPFNNIILNENLELSMNDFRASKILIEKYYDNNGIPHKFDIYVFQHANNKGVLSGPKKEYRIKEVVGWLKEFDVKKTNDFKYMFIVDERCSICNTLLSNVKNNTINKALENLSNISTFFLYYENRCPKGELHDFVININSKKENSCKKCGITKNIVDTSDKVYYNKFIKTYEKTQSEQRSLEKDDIKELAEVKIEKVARQKFAAWKINNASILELSRTFKIKYNILINLGLSSGVKYKLIENDQINPSSNINSDKADVRNLYLHGYYLNIVRKYYLIKHYEFNTNIPYDLKIIMAKNKVRDLNKKLPEIDSSILIQYEYYNSHETPSNVSNFLLHSISHTILNIFKNLTKIHVNVTHDIIMYMINSIISFEKLISEPEMSKFVIPGFRDTDNDNYTALNISDEDDDAFDGYASPVESIGELADLIDEDPVDEFATDELDMEQNEENMEMHHDF